MTDPALSLSASVTGPVILLAGLSIAFAAKHFLADFLLQTNWIARGKERPQDWLPALLVHVLCHAVLTLAIALIVAPRLWWLALVDFGVHLLVDRAKPIIARRGEWRADQPQYWWLFGLDQFIHQVTNIALATALVLL